MDFHLLNTPVAVTKEDVGGKGFFLHQMAQDQLPIPPAAMITTSLWKEYRADPKGVIAKLKNDIIPAMVAYFKEANNGSMPLVSVRSSGAVSMPGMMDTVLNVGITPKFFQQALQQEQAEPDEKAPKAKKPAKKTTKATKANKEAATNEEFLADVYKRLLTMYGDTVLDIPKDAIHTNKKFATVAEVESHFAAIYAKHDKAMPPQQAEEQILQCVLAVFNSWDNERAKLYRKLNNIDPNAGTAVVIQQMVFGNRNDHSATGVLFSRNPSNGRCELTGEYLTNAQGEDVVSGSATPKNINEMRSEFPEAYEELRKISERLEQKYKQVQDIEFTVEDNKVYILQARTAKCAPFAKLKMLMDMHAFNEITPQEVLTGLSLQEYLGLNVRTVDTSHPVPPDGQGLPGSMGALSGRVVFEPSSKYNQDATIFVAKETTPDDLNAIQMSTGILTATGGVTSHAAVVARGMGKVCVVGCKELQVQHKNGSYTATLNGKPLHDGDWITIDANTGQVWLGNDVPIIDAQNTKMFADLESMALDAHPEWTRITSKIDELTKGKKSYLLTYEWDNEPDDFIANELKDAPYYLTGVLDLTGKLDYLNEKYSGQFLFADIFSEKTFLRKKRFFLQASRDIPGEEKQDVSVYLGPYEKDHADDFERAGYKVMSSKEISFHKNTPTATLVLTQGAEAGIPDEKRAISAKNALLAALK